MKRLFLIIIALLFATPLSGADWSFSGSIRFATWYVDYDLGDYKIGGKGSDKEIQWYFQENSRVEAKVRADKVTGHIELALAGGAESGTAGGGDDTTVTTRRAYGVWKFSENAWLKVGKDYSPVTEFISNQWFWSDADLLGHGQFYGRRPAGLTLGIENFEVAFLTPTPDTPINNATGGDPDAYLPRVEASYMLNLEEGYIKPFGGFQYFKVEETDTGNITGDLDVYSWVVGLATNWFFGPFSIGGEVSYSMNGGNVQSWGAGHFSRSSSCAYLKGGDDLSNVYSLQWEIVPAVTVSEALRLEAGVGYRSWDPDNVSGSYKKTETWDLYLQGMITLAPGVFLCPEIGYFKAGENRFDLDAGDLWYAGAKWQVDF